MTDRDKLRLSRRRMLGTAALLGAFVEPDRAAWTALQPISGPLA